MAKHVGVFAAGSRASRAHYAFLLPLLILATFALSDFSRAESFDIGVEICTVDWHCGNYSEVDCGTRVCIDANNCNNNYNKPGEYIACPEEEEPPQSGGTGGGGGSITIFTNASESGKGTGKNASNYFYLSQNYLYIGIEPGVKVSRSIRVYSNSDQLIGLRAVYPTDYDGPQNPVTFESPFYVAKDIPSSFSLEFYTESGFTRPAAFTLLAFNDDVESSLSIIVVPVERNLSWEFDVVAPFAYFAQGKDDSLQIGIEFSDPAALPALMPFEAEFILYYPNGSIAILVQETLGSEAILADAYNYQLILPDGILPGYYGLAVRIQSGNSFVSKSIPIVVVPKTFSRIEQPSSPQDGLMPAYPKSFIVPAIVLAGALAIFLFAKLASTKGAGGREK